VKNNIVNKAGYSENTRDMILRKMYDSTAGSVPRRANERGLRKMSGTRTHRDTGVRGTRPREFDRMLKAESPVAKYKKEKDALPLWFARVAVSRIASGRSARNTRGTNFNVTR